MCKRNLYLFQPQYQLHFDGKIQYWLPYSIGSLWAYAQQFETVRRCWNLAGLFFRRESIDKVLDQMQDPALCGFSVYIWNKNYCLALAQAIKQRWPGCVIVFGGPQINGSWLRYDFIDSLVLKEGERCMVKILEDLAHGKPLDRIVSLPRMDDLSEIPSPYALGVFDDLVRDNPDILWSATLETNRGCPYSCTFCDWGGLTESKIKKFGLEKIKDDIDWMTNHPVRVLFITDANFGIFKQRDLEIARLVRGIADRGTLEYVSMNYPKHSNELVFEISREFGPVNKGITLSVQSMNPDTVKEIKRDNMALNDLSRMITLGEKYHISTYTELILGLPLETLESWRQGVADILEMGQHQRLEPQLCMILENTELHDRQKHQFDMKTIEVRDFITFGLDENSGISESAPMVCSTSTMSTPEFVEAFMYSWLVIHFHMAGYSKLISKYCRHVREVPYRVFYDRLLVLVTQDSGRIGAEYRRVRSAVDNFYHMGETRDPDIPVMKLQFYSQYNFYVNILDVMRLVESATRSLCEIDTGVMEIQKRFIQNNTWTCPAQIETGVDLETWSREPCVYELSNKIERFDPSPDNFYSRHRRQSVLQINIDKQLHCHPLLEENQ